MHEEKAFNAGEHLLDPGTTPLPSYEQFDPQLLVLTNALGVDPVPLNELPTQHEAPQVVPSKKRIFMQRIGPLALDHGVDIKTDYTIEDHILDYLIGTELSWSEIYTQLPSSNRKRVSDHALRRLYRLARRTLREKGQGDLIVELETSITEEHEAKHRSWNKDIDTAHPGLAIDMVRAARIRSGQSASLRRLVVACLGERAGGDAHKIKHRGYELRDFLLGRSYWRPYSLPELLIALDIPQKNQATFMRIYKEIYKQRLQNVQAAPLDQVTAKEATRLSPFGRPPGEDERKPHFTEEWEYLRRIGSVTNTPAFDLTSHFKPNDLRIYQLIEQGATIEEIQKLMHFSRGGTLNAIKALAGKVYFALPRERREEITAAVRAEIATDLFQLRDPYPGHPGPSLNIFRLELLSCPAHAHEEALTLQGIARVIACHRNEVLDFFEGRIFMRTKRVQTILDMIKVPSQERESFMRAYTDAQGRMRRDQRK